MGADIAGPMHLGTANGGLEVDGHAARRPAPTGLFASLGDDSATATSGNWLNRLVAFLRAVPDDLLEIVVTTIQRTDTYPITGITRPSFWEAVAGETRLRHAQGALEQISQQIATAVSANYTPSLQGFRLVLNPTFASFAEQESAVVSDAGAHDIGDNRMTRLSRAVVPTYGGSRWATPSPCRTTPRPDSRATTATSRSSPSTTPRSSEHRARSTSSTC